MIRLFLFNIKILLTVRFLFLTIFFLAVSMKIFAQNNDTTIVKSDTTIVKTDSLSLNSPADTSTTDSLKAEANGDFKSKVEYSADDSLYFDVENEVVYLYGNGSVKYEDMTLKANYIEVNLRNKGMYSTFTKDSAGEKAGIPDFVQSDNKFKADEIHYNFNTKKGKIKGVYTQQGEGYIHGETVKKIEDYEYIRNGLYTTCDLPHPHYGIAAAKLKVINNKKIITGPAYLVIEDVPLPLAIPFGFFPNRKGRSSGIIFPAYGESGDLGFYLKNGGYYFGLNDYVDAALTGDIYSKGSWGSQFFSNYANRYHYNGNLSFSYSRIQTGEKELPDFSYSNQYFVRWSHSQDPKARPNSLFTANVNAGTSNFYQVQVSSPINTLTNTYQSSISYSKTWPGTPFSFSSSLSHNQNSLTKDISISLPQASFNVSRIYPFARKVSIGEQKWYEKIGVSYTGTLQNQINTKDTILFPLNSQTPKLFNNGMQHTIPVSTSIKVLKFITLTPSANYTERWYTRTIEKKYLTDENVVVNDTVNGFKAARDFSTSASLNTRIYGMYQFKNSKVIAVRHVMSPTISFSYRPDFSTPSWHYYKPVQIDSLGHETKYSIFETGIFGSPSSGKSSLINFGLDNNIEMKTRKQTDSAETTKKIKIFESLSIASSYNIAADSLRWSNIGINGRTTLFDKINLTAGSSFDPYIVDATGNRRNISEWQEHHRLARLTSATMAIGFNLNHIAKKTTDKGSDADRKFIKDHPDDFVDLDVPFTLNVNYSLTYSKPGVTEAQLSQIVNFNGDLSLTPKWKIIFSSGYDFHLKDISYTSLSFYRDLHCWEMRFNWVPLGSFPYWNFQINVKASILQDLKYLRKNDVYDR
jgi:lipopolysaccharide assembly outer membrane protein LptD (OstA)